MTFLAGALAGALIVGPPCYMLGRRVRRRLDAEERGALWWAAMEHGRQMERLSREQETARPRIVR